MKFMHPAQSKHHSRDGSKVKGALRRDKGKGAPMNPAQFLARHHVGRGR